MDVRMKVPYHPHWSGCQHEFMTGDYLWHLMTYDKNGYAFCVDISLMDGIVFSVATYDEKPVSLADKCLEQMQERQRRAS